MRTRITAFEEARRYYLRSIRTTSEFLKKYTLGWELDDENLKISYKSVLQDLYLSYLEDKHECHGDYWDQVKEFRKWYDSLSREEVVDLVDKLLPESTQGDKRFSSVNSEEEALEVWKEVMGEEESIEVERQIIKVNGNKGKKKPVYRYLLPDGLVVRMSAQGVAQKYLSKGIKVTKLDE